MVKLVQNIRANRNFDRVEISCYVSIAWDFRHHCGQDKYLAKGLKNLEK